MSPRLPLILVAGVVALCIAGAVVAGVAVGTGGATAYSLNGHSVSQGTIDGELRSLHEHSKLASELLSTSFGGTNGAVSSSASALWINVRIQLELMREAAAHRNLVIKQSDRATLRKRGAKELRGLSSDVRDVFVDYTLYRSLLELDADQAASSFIANAFRKAKVTVDPRYGTWHPRRGVCPPTGCTSG